MGVVVRERGAECGLMVHVFAEIKIEKLTWHRNMDVTTRVSRTERPILNKYIINNE